MSLVLTAQSYNNLRRRALIFQSDTIQIDTLSLVPASVVIYDSAGYVLPDSLYYISYTRATLILKSESLKNKPMVLGYRTFYELFEKPYFINDIKAFRSSGNSYEYTRSTLYATSSDRIRVPGDDDIIRSGSISRGISVGNNRNASVTSGMNLQLNGKLSDDLFVMAAITDENIPLQPDGYTQQLQEFDRIFVRVYNSRVDAIFGDIVLSSPTGYFMRYDKKLLGASVTLQNNLNKSKKDTLINTFSGAVAKGKYNRYVFNGSEGNQGPYRLRGINNEVFIIVLAGSERIFIDGKLLARGEDNEYVIDYNTGELSFTPKQLITKDKRITVEFQYSERSYTRFTLQSANEMRTDKGRFWVNIISEQDGRNQSLMQDLSASDKRLLDAVGDSIANAYAPSIDTLAFDDARVMYASKDTIVNGNTYESIFIYSIDPSEAFYSVSFSYVGENKGDYLLSRNAANGKVYAWIAPQNGLKMGNFRPVRLLVAPNKKQMLTLGGDIALGKRTSTFTELALTNNDRNTFSQLDDNNNTGLALKSVLSHDWSPRDSSFILTTHTAYQFVYKAFDPLENFRDVEFARDWNLQSSQLSANEYIINAGLSLAKNEERQFNYDFDFMSRPKIYDAHRHSAQANYRLKTLNLNVESSFLNSQADSVGTTFNRHKITLTNDIRKLVLGVEGVTEDNRWLLNSDSLLGNSSMFQQYMFFLSSLDTAKNTFLLSYKDRRDFSLFGNDLEYATRGEDFSAGIGMMKDERNTLSIIATWRRLNMMNDKVISSIKEENTLLGRVDHTMRLKKGLLATNISYEIGAGMEPKKEFAYLEVAAGHGIYTWNDYNNNGIKELNEFEQAVYKDQANYIRVFTPTQEYIRAWSNKFSTSTILQPRKLLKGKGKLGRFICRFENNFAYNIENKNTNDDLRYTLNPFAIDIPDSLMVRVAGNLRNNFSFNKNKDKWGVDYLTQKTNERSILFNGFTENVQHADVLKLRLRVIKEITLFTDAGLIGKSSNNEYFIQNNFNIREQNLSNIIRITSSDKIMTNLTYLYSEKHNRPGNEYAIENNVGIEFNYMPSKSSLNAKVNYIHLQYPHLTNTPLAYEILHGLMPGNNITCSLLYQMSFSGGIELYIGYEGRKSPASQMIHTGSMQVRANF